MLRLKNRGTSDLRLQLLALYLVFVIPIFFVALFFYYNAGQRLRADISAADLSLARAIALETDAMLQKAKDSVIEFARVPAVIQADPPGMALAFTAAATARQDINLFYRLSADGIMLYHYPPNPQSTVGQDFSFRDYFQQARDSGAHVFSKGRVSPTTGRPVVTSVMPVLVDGRFDGVVATNLELQALTETVQRIGLKLTRSQGVKIIIVDAAGQIIAHSEPENLLQKLDGNFPGLEAILAKQEGSLMARDAAGNEWLYSYTPVPIANWGVVVQRSSRLAFASLDSFQRGLLLALALFSLGAVFFWLILSRRVISPLVTLTRYGETVAGQTGPTDFDRRQVEPISERADQVGRLTRVLLRAEQSIRLRLLELTTLNKTSAAVVSTLDTEQVINTILNEVQRLLSVRQCSLLILNETSQQLEVRASRGLSDSYPRRIDLTETCPQLPACRAITTGQPVQVADVASDPDFTSILHLARSEGYRSLLVMPLQAPHVSGAALTIYRAEVHHFTEQEISLAASFANYAAIALEHATLFSLTDAELQKRVRFLSALNRVSHTVSQSLVVDDVLNYAMEAVFEVMPADACWIYLQRASEDFLRLRAQHGVPSDLLEQIRNERIWHGQGLIGRVVQNGQPLLLTQTDMTYPEWAADLMMAHGYWHTIAVTPMLAKDNIIGVLGMAAAADNAFSQAEVELLEAIGNQIAIAVVNARLYRRSREVATLEERNRVAREIHDTLAQGFTGILVQLQAAERLSLKNPEKAVESLQSARDLARESLQEARRSVLNLRPTALEQQPLDRVIAREVHRLANDSGLQTSFNLEGYPSPLNPAVEQNLYRITQEALTNVRRHARATRVDVTLTFDTNNVILTITDDGIGLNNAPGHSPPPNGFGLVGIRERVNLIRGQVIFDQPPAGGTRIKVEIAK